MKNVLFALFTAAVLGGCVAVPVGPGYYTTPAPYYYRPYYAPPVYYYGPSVYYGRGWGYGYRRR